MELDLREQNKQIRRHGNRAAWAVLTMQIASAVCGVAVGILRQGGLLDWLVLTEVGDKLIPVDVTSYLLFQIGYYFLLMVIPVLVGCLLLRKTGESPAPTQPVKAGLFVGLLFAGMGVFAFANFVSNFVVSLAADFGITPAKIPETVDGTLLNLLLNLLSTALLPAVLEELLFRGVTVGLLRPVGDRTAVLMSAVLFAMAHGTLTQIPFAFILGLAFAFIYVRTNNILLVMLLHFINNGLAVMLEFALCYWPESQVMYLQYLAFAVMTLGGLIAVLLLTARRNGPLRMMGDGDRPFAEQWPRALFAPVSVVFLVVMLVETLASVNFA